MRLKSVQSAAQFSYGQRVTSREHCWELLHVGAVCLHHFSHDTLHCLVLAVPQHTASDACPHRMKISCRNLVITVGMALRAWVMQSPCAWPLRWYIPKIAVHCSELKAVTCTVYAVQRHDCEACLSVQMFHAGCQAHCHFVARQKQGYKRKYAAAAADAWRSSKHTSFC